MTDKGYEPSQGQRTNDPGCLDFVSLNSKSMDGRLGPVVAVSLSLSLWPPLLGTSALERSLVLSRGSAGNLLTISVGGADGEVE